MCPVRISLIVGISEEKDGRGLGEVASVINPSAHVPRRPEDIADKGMPVCVDMRGRAAKRSVSAWPWQTIDIINRRPIEWVDEPGTISRRPIAKVGAVDGVPVRRIAVHVKAPIALEQHVVPAHHVRIVKSNLLPSIGADRWICAVAADVAIVHVVVGCHGARPGAARDHDLVASD